MNQMYLIAVAVRLLGFAVVGTVAVRVAQALVRDGTFLIVCNSGLTGKHK